MPSKGDIINDALHHIGEPESDTPDTDASTWVRRIRNRYDARVRAVLEDHSWNFARKVEQLTATEPTPEGWDYGFTKPVNCYHIIKVASTNDPRHSGIHYEDRAGRICTNSSTTFLTYVDGYWKDYPGSWSQAFADAVSADLAFRVIPVTDARLELRDRLERGAVRALQTARNWDARQQPIWEPPPGKWDRARRASRGGYIPHTE